MPKRSDIRITRTSVEAWRREALRDKSERVFFDRDCAGFGVRVKPNGFTYFFIQYRRHGITKKHAIGPFSADPTVPYTVDQARTEAQRERIKVRQDPEYDPARDRKRRLADAAEGKDSLRSIGAKFIEDVAKPKKQRDGQLRGGIRSWREYERILQRYVFPILGDRRIYKIRRRDVSELLDAIENRELGDSDGGKLGGPVMADRVLATVRRIFNWYATRDDDFISPIVKGMARTKSGERARKRVLVSKDNTDELRALWTACDTVAPSVFGAMVKLLLLTGQRRDEVASMEWSEVTGDTWTIPAERYKTKRPNVVPLSKSAQAILSKLSRDGDFVFTTGATTSRPATYDPKEIRPFGNISRAKSDLDALMLAELRRLARERGDDPAKIHLERWTLHDLRRTAKTLMSGAGVRPDISERVLGHVIRGVEGVYEQHDFEGDKRRALEALAAYIDRILNPPADKANVIDWPAMQSA